MAWQGFDAIPQILEGPGVDLEPRPLTCMEAPPTVAVDGSDAVLVDNGAYWIVAVRAAAVGCEPPPPEMHVHATPAGDAAQTIRDAYEARGLPAPRVPSAEAYAAAHRGLLEMDTAIAAIRGVPEGGLLLIDGALTELPEGPQAIADRLLDRAVASGLHIAGVSKRSALTVGGRPLLPGLAKRPGRWWAEVPGASALVAKLHPHAHHAFRIDAEAEVLPWLADLARDAVYRGYPYPLAKVHNRVTITGAEARRLGERLVRRLGPAARDLDDFHAVLDRNVPR